MEKVMIKLVVPAIFAQYEMLLPVYIGLDILMPMLIDAVTEQSGQRYLTSGTEILCMNQDQVLNDIYKTLEDYQIQNGDILYMF